MQAWRTCHKKITAICCLICHGVPTMFFTNHFALFTAHVTQPTHPQLRKSAFAKTEIVYGIYGVSYFLRKRPFLGFFSKKDLSQFFLGKKTLIKNYLGFQDKSPFFSFVQKKVYFRFFQKKGPFKGFLNKKKLLGYFMKKMQVNKKFRAFL